MLYQLGPITFDSPGGLNPQGVDIEFGSDFAVKPVVGAAMPREYVGPSDFHFALAGTIFPFRQAHAGVGSGLGEIELLTAIGQSGEAQLLVRGDGYNFGFFLIEKGSLRQSVLNRRGIGKVIEFQVSLVRSPEGPSIDGMLATLDLLFG